MAAVAAAAAAVVVWEGACAGAMMSPMGRLHDRY